MQTLAQSLWGPGPCFPHLNLPSHSSPSLFPQAQSHSLAGKVQTYFHLQSAFFAVHTDWNILPPDILFDKFLMFPNILCFLILLTSEVFPRLCYLIMKSASIPHFWHFSHCYAFLYMLYVYIHNFLYNFIYYTFFCLLVFIFKDVIPFWILSFNPKGQGNCFVHC